MKKYINRKVYDTDTAKFLDGWSNDFYQSDFEYCYEALYVTKSGNYFIYGSGGPLSKYAVHSGNDTNGSQVIKPVSYTAAKDWAEEKLSGDEYEAIFGIVEDGVSELHIQISNEAKQKLDRLKSEQNTTLSALIENLITSA